MALLWDNLAQQLSSVRSSTPTTPTQTSPGPDVFTDNRSDRRRRLETALLAIQDSGNTMMIESLKAAIEGRKANLNFPPLPAGISFVDN